MDGYSIGEPHFSRRLEENVNTLIKALKDPALPLLELQVRYRQFVKQCKTIILFQLEFDFCLLLLFIKKK